MAHSINNLNSTELFEMTGLQKIKDQAFEFILSRSFYEAANFSRQLESVLLNSKPKNSEEELIFSVLWFWMARLKVFAFKDLTKTEQDEFFNKYLVYSFENGLDLRKSIYEYTELFEVGSVIEDLVKPFFNSIVTSQDVLGENTEAFKKQGFIPTVSNWLQEFEYNVNKKASSGGFKTKSFSFDLISFIGSNPKVNLLNANEKQALENIIKLYDFLKTPVVYIKDETFDVSKQVGSVTNLISQEKVATPPTLKAPPIKAFSPSQNSLATNLVKKPVFASEDNLQNVNIQDVLYQKIPGAKRGLQMENAGATISKPSIPKPPVPAKQEVKSEPQQVNQAVKPAFLPVAPPKPVSNIEPGTTVSDLRQVVSTKLSESALQKQAATVEPKDVINSKLEALKKKMGNK